MTAAQRLATHPRWPHQKPTIGVCLTWWRNPAGVKLLAGTRASKGAWLPDLSDDATAGVLLRMLYDAVSGDVTVMSGRRPPDMARACRVTIAGSWAADLAPTLGEAVALALLDVWGER